MNSRNIDEDIKYKRSQNNMCKIMMKLKGIKSKPVSKSFDNIDRIPDVIENIGRILENNKGTVITPENRQKINEQIHVIYKKA